MSRVWAITLNTFREAIRNRILYALLFFSVLFIGAATVLSHLTIGEYSKVVKDTGLSVIALFGVLIAIFVGIGLVNRDIERKTIYTIATKPVSRGAIVLGKYLGLVLVLAVMVSVMGLVYVLTLMVNAVAVDGWFLVALWLTLMELMVITAFAVLYSTFSSPTVASFFSLSTYVIGHLTGDIRAFGEQAEKPLWGHLAQLQYWVLPNLENFNVRTEVAYAIALPADFIALTTLYGLLYSAVVLGVAAVVFRHRDF
jgi:ABC-type transport system involved in multi-copper enzyme maturation permease subunit